MHFWWCILFLPLLLSAQEPLDTLVAMPYDAMVADLPKAEQRLLVGLERAEQSKDSLAMARLHAKLSTVKVLSGDHEASLQHGLNALELFQQLGLFSEAGGMYCGIGYQMKRRDLGKAIGYMRQGLRMLEQHPDSAQLEPGYSNYGVLMEMRGQLDSALHFYHKAHSIARAKNDSIAIPYSLHHIGGVLMMMGNYEKAKQLFDEGLLIRTLRHDRNGMAESHVFLGEYFKQMGQPDSAKAHFDEAIGLSLELANPYMRQYCYEQLALMYESSGEFGKALAYRKQFDAVKDSLLQKQRAEQLAKMETRFETAQKERENLQLKQQQQEQELVLARQRSLILALVAGTLILILSGLFFFQRNKRLAEAKRNAAILEERERGLKALIQATENERKRIAKDLHDGVVQTLTSVSLRLQKQALSEEARSSGLDKDMVAVRAVLDDSIAEVRGISHQMMPRVLADMGLIPAIEDMLHKSLGSTDVKYEFEHHKVEGQRFPEHIEVSLYRIAQELINNIIKHSEAKAVSVQLFRIDRFLMLVVEDNGKGFRTDDPATRNGIGLMNIFSRVQAIHGEVNYQPSPEQGTVATIRVPLN